MAAFAAAALCSSCVPQHEALGPEIKYLKFDGKNFSIFQHDTVDFAFHAIAGDAAIDVAPNVIYSLGANVATPAKAKAIYIKGGYAVTLNQILHEVGLYTFIVSVADNDGMDAADTVKVTVISNAPLGTDTTISLGSGADTAGSFYSIETKTVYTAADAPSKAAEISFGYRYDAATKASIYSATESAALKDSAGVTETKFVRAAAANFADATEADLAKFSPNATKLTGLAKNEVIAYKTASGATGLILIEGLDEDGTITLVVKKKQ